MLKLLVLFVLFAVVSNSAYDFKDEPFNELIFENYKNLSEHLDEAQYIDIEKLRGIKCCNEKINLKSYNNSRKLKKECFKEINGDKDDEYHFEKLEEIESKIICLTECIARKLEIVDDSGNIMRDDFIELVKRECTDPELQWKLDAVEEITDKCLAEINIDESSDEDFSSSVDPQCNPSALKFAHCTWRESIRACPKHLQVDSPKCIKLREELENGDTSI